MDSSNLVEMVLSACLAFTLEDNSFCCAFKLGLQPLGDEILIHYLRLKDIYTSSFQRDRYARGYRELKWELLVG